MAQQSLTITRPAMLSIEPGNFAEAEALAIKMAESSVMPEMLRGKPADILAIALMGRDLQLTFMQSMRGIYVIKGRPFVSADLLVSLCLTSGAAEYFTCTASSAQAATYRTHRRGDPQPIEMSYTIEQAKRATLTGKDVWRDSPEDMLRHRCAAKLARMVYPDVVLGTYVHEEAAEIEARESTPITLGTEAPAPPEKQEPSQFKISIDKVLGRLAKLGVQEGAALAYCDGDYDALIQLGRALKAGSITPQQVADRVREKAEASAPAEGKAQAEEDIQL